MNNQFKSFWAKTGDSGKRLMIGTFVVVGAFVAILFWCNVIGFFFPPNSDSIFGDVKVLSETCRMIDYEITDNRISFRYEMYWENTTEYDWEISYFQMVWRKNEIDGWFQEDDDIHTPFENGNYSVIIPAGETVQLVVVAEGLYLGGVVNTNLSDPDRMMYSLSPLVDGDE